MEPPFYRNRPIGSMNALGRALGRSPQQLYRLAERAPKMYPLAKSVPLNHDGSKKLFYNPAPPIKELQREMIAAIFDAVTFPPYINGGIKLRSYRDDCLLHTQARTVVNLDISTFFESVTAADVERLWRRFFNFAPEVTELLTYLTTYQGRLPRGAPSSSYLANLLFWDVEPRLQATLAQRGIVYSRYIDDVSLSARRVLSKEEIDTAPLKRRLS